MIMYAPNHLLGPGEPTFVNRLICKTKGHEKYFLEANTLSGKLTLLCMRCSLLIEEEYPVTNVDSDKQRPVWQKNQRHD